MPSAPKTSAPSGVTAVPEGKLQAYCNALYRFGQGHDASTLRIGVRSQALARLYTGHNVRCSAFITASNPEGRMTSPADNASAHDALRAALAALGTKAIEGAGLDPSGEWPAEASFLALGAGLDDAQALGARFRQDAIVWSGEDAVPRLILLR